MITLMQQGGAVIWVIAAVGAFALTIFLERFFHLHRARIKSDDFVRGIRNILERGNVAEALSICAETPGPVARIARAAILYHEQDQRRLDRAVDEAALNEMAMLERRFVLLATAAQAAPLLGLFGTVLAMIEVFLAVERGVPLVNAGDIAGGIWPALLSTAAGLAVAIPSYAGYNLLVAMARAIALDMEKAAGEIIGFLGVRAAAGRAAADGAPRGAQ